MALRLAEVEPREYVYVCTPTGDELPMMLNHWARLEEILRQPIVRVGHQTLATVIDKHNSLPSWRMRFCTRELKIYPIQEWLEDQLPATMYVGLRADEETRHGLVTDDEGLIVRHPFREWGWGINEVLGYLDARGIEIPERTDCARCFYQTLHEWYLLWRDYPDIWASAVADEQRFGHTYRSPQRDTQPTALVDLGAKFATGYVPKKRKRGEGCRVCSM
jgi:hypothetical protein